MLFSTSHYLLRYYILSPPPVSSTLFPYTTLFRSYYFRDVDSMRWGTELVRMGNGLPGPGFDTDDNRRDRKSTRLNSSHLVISYAVFCLKKKKKEHNRSTLLS